MPKSNNTSCPFCSSDDLDIVPVEGNLHAMRCLNKECGATGPVKNRILDAVTAWADRAPARKPQTKVAIRPSVKDDPPIRR